MPRRPSSTGNGHSKTHVPGIYEQVLVKTCAEDAANPGAWLDASVNPLALSTFERERAQRVAELIAERRGKPVHVRSHQLPPGLPEPFGQFPRGQRTFVVRPDDSITLRTMGAWQ